MYSVPYSVDCTHTAHDRAYQVPTDTYVHSRTEYTACCARVLAEPPASIRDMQVESHHPPSVPYPLLIHRPGPPSSSLAGGGSFVFLSLWACVGASSLTSGPSTLYVLRNLHIISASSTSPDRNLKKKKFSTGAKWEGIYIVLRMEQQYQITLHSVRNTRGTCGALQAKRPRRLTDLGAVLFLPPMPFFS